VKIGINCTHCHGKLDEHAVSLLLGQENSRTAKLLLKNLNPRNPHLPNKSKETLDK